MHWNRISVHANWVVPGEEDDDRHQRVPWQLDGDIGKHENLPRVRFRWPFTDFVQRPLSYKVRQYLLQETPENLPTSS